MERNDAVLRFSFPKPYENMSLEAFAHSISSVYRTGKLNYVSYKEINILSSKDREKDKEFLNILETVDPMAFCIAKIVNVFD